MLPGAADVAQLDEFGLFHVAGAQRADTEDHGGRTGVGGEMEFPVEPEEGVDILGYLHVVG
jgi:hypothetical protein